MLHGARAHKTINFGRLITKDPGHTVTRRPIDFAGLARHYSRPPNLKSTYVTTTCYPYVAVLLYITFRPNDFSIRRVASSLNPICRQYDWQQYSVTRLIALPSRPSGFRFLQPLNNEFNRLMANLITITRIYYDGSNRAGKLLPRKIAQIKWVNGATVRWNV